MFATLAVFRPFLSALMRVVPDDTRRWKPRSMNATRGLGACAAVLAALLALLVTAPARAASFNWGTASCITGGTCDTVGSITRYSNAVNGGQPRDILLEVVALQGASVYTPAAAGGGGAYIDGRVLGSSAAGAATQVHFRLTFVLPGTSTPAGVTGPVYLTSLDTDGYNSHVSGGFRERIEFITPPSATAIGSQLEVSTATSPSATPGIAFRPIVCTDAAAPGCGSGDNGVGVNGYVHYYGLNLTPTIAATALYTGTVTQIDFAFGVEVSAAGVGGFFDSTGRQYGIAGGTPEADMTPTPIACTPSPSAIGTATTCSTTCTNAGPDVAVNPSCDFTGTLPAGAVRGAGCGTFSGVLLSGATRTCSITFTPTSGGTVALTGGTGAANDRNGGTDPAAGNNPTSGSVVVSGPTTADMSAAFVGLPTAVRPGQTFSGLQIVCTNAPGSAAALVAACAPSVSAGTVSAVACSPAVGGSLAAGQSITCTFDYAAPGAAGGTDEPTTSITFTGTTGATNDAVPANNTTAGAADLVDALDEGTTTPSGVAASLSVLANDTRGLAGATLANVSLTVVTPATPGAAFDVSNGSFSVPANAAPGTYTVTYQLCASPAVTPAACDTATATIVVGPAADMSPAFGPLPGAVHPGQTYTGLQLTCTNAAGGGAAVAATCAPQASVGTVSAVSCTPPSGSGLAAGAPIVCSFSYTAPGVQGGADEPATAVTFTGTTGAANDGVPGNNTVAAAAAVVDAIDDTATHPGGLGAQTTSLAANDQHPVGSVFTRTGGTCAGASVSAAGLATYDVPASGACTVTYQVCAPAPDATACDLATLTVGATGADMAAAFTGIPSVLRPGQPVGGLTLTCSNVGGAGAATAATCTPSASAGTVSNVACTPAAGGSVAPGGTIACTFDYTAPGTPGGADEPVTAVTFTGTTGARNDTNPANDATTAVATLIDAVDDSVGQPGGTTGRTSPVAPNDQAPVGSTFSRTGGTCANASVDAAGLATFDVPAAGNCTVTYQVCAPAPLATTCDTATLTVVPGAADMTPAFGPLPGALRPGQTVTGLQLVCTNAAGGSAATAATCAPSASAGTVSSVACTPAAGGSVAAGGTIACTFDYTAPGTRGGTDEPATAITFRGQTGAVNDAVGGTGATGNNLVTAAAAVVDAIDDTDVKLPGTTGQTTSVAANDQIPAGSTFSRTGGTCAFASMSPAGAATYDVPATGSCTVVYDVCAPAPDAAACDTATLTVSVSAADLAPAFAGLPDALRPGQRVTGATLTCTNAAGSAVATGTRCAPSASAGTIDALACSPAVGTDLAAGAAIVCTFDYTAPGTPGGTREALASVTFTGVTGALNDTQGGTGTGGNNTVTRTAPVVDAVDDGPATVGAAGGRVPLYGNDALGGGVPAPASVVPTLVDTSRLIGAAIDPSTGELVVPAGAAPGSYVLTYQICAAATPSACDTATVRVTVQGADMVPTITGLPTAASPGATVAGTLTCTNRGPAEALQVGCGAEGATVGACTVGGAAVTLPLATLPAGGSVTCALTATAPTTGTLALVGTTGASNDLDATNNRTPAALPVIDTVNDGPVTVPPTGTRIDLHANDTVGGQPLGPTGPDLALTDAGGLAGVVLDPSGTLVVPADTTPGRYTLTYRACVRPAAVPAACDTATVVLDVVGQPDLQVGKTHAPAVFTERHTGTYTIVARNTGGYATSLPYTVVDTLPAGMTVAAVPTGTGWDCRATALGASTATCTSAVPIAAGASGAPITLVVQVAAGTCASPDAQGLCSVAAGTAPVNRVAIQGGGESGSGGASGNNTGTDPTPVQQAGAIRGRVWLDADHDRAEGGGERGVPGMEVEVLDAAGTRVGTATTDAAGEYRVDGLIPGPGYAVRFRDPASGAYYGRPVSRDPEGGNDPSAAGGTGVVGAGIIRNLTVPAGTRARINQSLPLDPAGVVYASDSRSPVGGARVELLDATGAALPATCVIGGASSVVTPGSGALAGAYSFLLANPAPSGCPGAGVYRLRVTPDATHVASALIPAQDGTLTPPAGCVNGAAGGVCTVQAQNVPPTGVEPTPYYLVMRLDPATGPDVVNNHIPLDPAIRPALLVVKTGDRTQAELGDSVRYAITVRRTDGGSATLPALEVIDTLPAGFRYIEGTAQLDGVAVADPTGRPGPVLRFALGAMGPGRSVTLTYRVRLGVGSMQGTGINRAQATGTPGASCGSTPDALCSNVSQFRVRVTGGVFAAEACMTGKVFVDCNHNHVQDAEELGIPGVRMILADGTTLVSDVEGKYSVCGLAPRTQVMVVDPTTLPRGSRLTTTSNRNAGDAGSLFLDLKNGELHRADVVEGSCSNTVLEQVKARRARGETQSVETEKRGGRVLKFDGKPVDAPAQATDRARQRGDAAGRGEPGAVKPRQDGGQPAREGALTETTETIRRPVSINPASSGLTQPPAEGEGAAR